jgi:hypothetical protein
MVKNKHISHARNMLIFDHWQWQLGRGFLTGRRKDGIRACEFSKEEEDADVPTVPSTDEKAERRALGGNVPAL